MQGISGVRLVMATCAVLATASAGFGQTKIAVINLQRAVLESAGVKDILSKSLGSNNAANVVKATLHALLSLRQRDDIYRSRGLEIKKSETKAGDAVLTN